MPCTVIPLSTTPSVHQDCKWNIFTNNRISCTMWLVKLFFENMWAGPVSTTSVINNLLPGCRVDKLNSFHHLRHPHLLPSQTCYFSQDFKVYFSNTFRGQEGGTRCNCAHIGQKCQLKQNPFFLYAGTCRNYTQTCFESNKILAQRCSEKIRNLELQKSCNTF